MNSKIFNLALFLFPILFLFAQESNQKSVAITVYNNNLGVVKDLRTLDIKSGLSTIKLTDVAQYIDPTSVHIGIDGEILEQNFQYDLVSMEKILTKYLDKSIQLVNSKGELLEGILLTANGNQIVLKKNDGGLLMLSDISEYQISVNALPEGLITKPTLVWLLKAPKSGKQDVEVSYQTSGMNWHAEYVAVLNENDNALDLNSWISVDNRSGATFKNAKLKLIAGDVNLVKPQNNGRRYKGDIVMMEAMQPQFEEKEFFEYHIYNLQRPTTLSNNETKQVSLFEANNVKANKKYYYKGGNYYGNNSNQKVAVIIEFENSKSNNLNIPMPKGKVRVYKSDGDALEFIGEDLIDHTPKNEKLRLKIGEAFDIVVNDVQTNNIKIAERVSEQEYEITIKNKKNENIVVDVERNLGANWTILNSSLDFEKINSQNILFKVPVKAEGETVLKYKVRYSY
ncbi:MAG: DUF4139 domain-containing protein [Ignavibacteriales bacterium CG18_big_fil_WC_8_21_14_2_50_31_20]|nr:MAG: DUF4139 domain-containing protein [Ignavibacteriales bacterium CG18_big_fil_WC_8_21_14_2_50_31_20]